MKELLTEEHLESVPASMLAATALMSFSYVLPCHSLSVGFTADPAQADANPPVLLKEDTNNVLNDMKIGLIKEEDSNLFE